MSPPESATATVAAPSTAVAAAPHATRLPAYRRILLKLSGEALMGDLPYGADPDRIASIAEQVKTVADRGVEVAIVVGGGNIYRGL